MPPCYETYLEDLESGRRNSKIVTDFIERAGPARGYLGDRN